MNRYRYYEDLYHNEYRWGTQRSETDGKFVACIYKYKSIADFTKFALDKERRFNQRQMAKAWCLKNSRKAIAHQRVVLNSREERKAERKGLLPVYTKLELRRQKVEKDMVRLKKNIARADTKMKSLTTRKKIYQKKIKYLVRRLNAITQ